MSHSDSIATCPNLTDLIHSKGINMRFLGVILQKALQTKASTPVIQRLLTEMVARTFKACLFRSMRQVVAHSANKIDQSCKLVAAHTFSLLLADSYAKTIDSAKASATGDDLT